MSWRAVGSVLPSELTGARLELHWAAQLASAPGTSWLAPAADFGHTTLRWDSALGVLAGRTLARTSLRAALVFEALELAVVDVDTERVSFQLAGATLAEALEWLRQQMNPEAERLELPAHDMPSHPVVDGVPFSEGGSQARTELAAWFSNATWAIHGAVADEAGASLVRCWPHHFDVASLVTLDPNEDSETARSIGIGFSPGDGSYAEPYFYVNPWPYPSADALPSLESGAAHWHTDGWTGAVFTASRILSEAPERRAEFVTTALQEAIAASHEALAG
jgi:hypothetical protein